MLRPDPVRLQRSAAVDPVRRRHTHATRCGRHIGRVEYSVSGCVHTGERLALALGATNSLALGATSPMAVVSGDTRSSVSQQILLAWLAVPCDRLIARPAEMPVRRARVLILPRAKKCAKTGG